MQDILKAVSENPLVPIGGILLGVIGILLAVAFYIRSRRVSSVRYDEWGTSDEWGTRRMGDVHAEIA
jgi:hypothetical protein